MDKIDQIVRAKVVDQRVVYCRVHNVVITSIKPHNNIISTTLVKYHSISDIYLWIYIDAYYIHGYIVIFFYYGLF